jgi:non-specific serine/threonine protein kinase
MGSSRGVAPHSSGQKESSLKGTIQKLRKRRIIETLAAFIAGGWLLIEVVERLLVGHYKFPEETIDLTVVSVIGALLSTLIWRWFRGAEKRPGNVKIEVLLVPLIILATIAMDVILILQILNVSGKKLLIGIIAFLLGIAWAIFKLSQWAAVMPESGKKEVEISPTAPAKPEKSIVVLPFKNISPEDGQDYFCDGMTEEIITKLSKVLSLRVISRTSAFMFKDTPRDVRSIAQELKVGYVLEGSVRKAGNKLRIAGQLIDAAADTHIWSETYDGILDDVFDIQEKVARAMVDTLQLRLTAPEDRQIAQKPISNVQAHDFYLRARDALYRGFTAEGIDEAIRFLEFGLKIAGDNPLLLATLANVYFQAVRVWVKEEAELAKAEEYAHTALRFDPGMAPAYTVLGYIHWLQGNPRDYYRLLNQALTLDPNDGDTLMWAFWLFIVTGRTSKALDIAEHIIELDPVHPYGFFYPAAAYAYEGRFELAVDYVKDHVSAGSPPQPTWAYWLGLWLIYAGRPGEATKVLEPVETMTTWNLNIQAGRLLGLALKGRKLDVEEMMTDKFRDAMKRDCVASCFVAEAYVLLDEREEAINWVEIAVNHGFIHYPFLSQYNPLLTKLRGEPRFKKLMERVKYEWEHFEV